MCAPRGSPNEQRRADERIHPTVSVSARSCSGQVPANVPSVAAGPINVPVTDEAPPAKNQYALVPPGWLAGAPVSKALIVANVAVYVAQVVLARTTDSIMRIPAHESLEFG